MPMAGDSGHGIIRRQLQSSLNMGDEKYEGCTSYIKHFISEFVGTGLLVFLGCMGVFANPDSHLGVALFFGMAAFIAIQITAVPSGGHINPVVSIAGILFKKLSVVMALVHILAQCLGSIFFFGLLRALTPDLTDNKICSNIPGKKMEIWQTFITEFVLTGVLLLVVCSAWDPRNAHLHDCITFKFGITISTLAFVGVAYSGCGMNPARSLGPAIWENQWTDHWVFWVGPILGGLFVCGLYRLFFWPPTPPATLPRVSKIELETIHTTS